MVENILRHLDEASPEMSRLQVVYQATSEVSGAVLTAVSTTVVGFLPVFTMTAAEGKLFKPLAYTKTFALVASIIVALAVIPAAAQLLITGKVRSDLRRRVLSILMILAGVWALFALSVIGGMALIVAGIFPFVEKRLPDRLRAQKVWIINGLAALVVATILAHHWVPLGPEKGDLVNTIFVVALVGGILLFFQLFQWFYPTILRWALRHRALFLSLPTFLLVMGIMVWLGFDGIFGWLPNRIKRMGPISAAMHTFPGLAKSSCRHWTKAPICICPPHRCMPPSGRRWM